jgi:hypothetical protein
VRVPLNSQRAPVSRTLVRILRQLAQRNLLVKRSGEIPRDVR